MQWYKLDKDRLITLLERLYNAEKAFLTQVSDVNV